MVVDIGEGRVRVRSFWGRAMGMDGKRVFRRECHGSGMGMKFRGGVGCGRVVDARSVVPNYDRRDMLGMRIFAGTPFLFACLCACR